MWATAFGRSLPIRIYQKDSFECLQQVEKQPYLVAPGAHNSVIH